MGRLVNVMALREWRRLVRVGGAGIVLIFAVDAVFGRYSPPLVVAALLDEPAHAATALLVLGAIRARPPAPFLLGALLGSVLIDVDHVPIYLGWDALTASDGSRPYTHSLLAVLAAVLAGRRTDGAVSRVIRGAAFGIAAHLLRDMATGGVPLLWPVSAQSVRLPYQLYAASLLLAWRALAWRTEAGASGRSFLLPRRNPR